MVEIDFEFYPTRGRKPLNLSSGRREARIAVLVQFSNAEGKGQEIFPGAMRARFVLYELAARRRFIHFILADAKVILLIPILHGVLDVGFTCDVLVTASEAFHDPEVLLHGSYLFADCLRIARPASND